MHLVWAPLGTAPLQRFLAAYGERDAGRAHRLTVVLNGFASRAQAAAHERLLAEVEHDALLLERPVQDLLAYRAAAVATSEPVACFVNSFSRPLVDGWLERLCAPLARRGVGAVGATATYESHLSSIDPRSPRAIADLARHALVFPRFPNPSLRTNAFAIAPARYVDLAPRRLHSKFAAHAFESGRRGLTAQGMARGGPHRVANRPIVGTRLLWHRFCLALLSIRGPCSRAPPRRTRTSFPPAGCRRPWRSRRSSARC